MRSTFVALLAAPSLASLSMDGTLLALHNSTRFDFARDPNIDYPGRAPNLRKSTAPDLDLTDAKRNILLAEASYCSSSSVTAWSCAACEQVSGISSPMYIETSYLSYRLAAFVALDDETQSVVVSFRGSTNIPNWLSNIDFVKTAPYADYPDASVHRGFYEDWLALRSDVNSAIASLAARSGYATVTMVGHSLGGALATLGAFDVQRDATFAVRLVATCGSPRVGDAAFSAAVGAVLAGREQRVTHHYDIVPHVPMMAMGFWHVAREYWLNEANTAATTCDGTGEDDACSNSCSPLSCTSTDDHLNYLGVVMGGGGC